MRELRTMLNAKMHKQEAQIVEDAGKSEWLRLLPIWLVVEQINYSRSKAAGGL
jgi:hypothetical protein